MPDSPSPASSSEWVLGTQEPKSYIVVRACCAAFLLNESPFESPYSCDLDAGHSGYHVARRGGEVVRVWPCDA